MHNTCSCVSLKVYEQNLCKPGKHLNKLKIVSLHIWDELFYCVGGKSFVCGRRFIYLKRISFQQQPGKKGDSQLSHQVTSTLSHPHLKIDVKCAFGAVCLWCSVTLVHCVFGAVCLCCNVTLVHCAFGAVCLCCNVTLVQCTFGAV